MTQANDSRLRQAQSAAGELTKFNEELEKFNSWLTIAEKDIEHLDLNTGELDKLADNQNKHKVQ